MGAALEAQQRKTSRPGRRLRRYLPACLVVVAVALVVWTIELGVPPLASTTQTLAVVSWCVVLLYVAVAARWEIGRAGAFTIPLAAAAIVLTLFGPTGAGELPAKYVIHQASMALGGRTTDESLRLSTRAVLRIAEDTPDIFALAFPAVGTGIAGFNMKQCAEIMLEEVRRHVAGGTGLTDVTFVLFDEAARRVFQETYDRVRQG